MWLRAGAFGRKATVFLKPAVDLDQVLIKLKTIKFIHI